MTTDSSPSAPQSMAEAEDHEWVDHAVRFGMVAYGLVYLLLGWLALQLALGDSEGPASTSGALRQLAQQPFGQAALWLVAVGLVALVLWRALEAVAGHRGEEDMKRKRLGSAAKGVLYASLAFTAVQVALADSGSGGSGGGSGGSGKSSGSGGSGGSGGGSSSTESATAQLMQLPGGQLLVGAVGLAVLGYALAQLRRSWSEDFRENLAAQGKSGHSGRAYVLAGKIGYAAKGVAVSIVGALVLYAAITHEASRSGGLDEALQEVLQQPFGPVLLGLVAVGIACYGVFCFARARHLRR